VNTLNLLLQERATQAIRKAFPDIQEIEADIAPCAQEAFGHYQCNSALRLSKILKKSPLEIAEKLAAHFDLEDQKGDPMISNLEIAGPGFINITFAPSFLSLQLQKVLRDPYYGAQPAKNKQKVIVEFSSPNIAKELHVGHLRSTIIGDCLARLFEFLNYDVLRLNHIGDWGTQFGMLIVYIKDHMPMVLNGEQEAELSQLMHWYKASKQQFDQDPSFKKRAQLEVVKLQSGDSEALRAWEIICDISRKAFQEIYDLLGVKLIERGESFYNPMLKKMVSDLEERGVLQVSDGAKCIFLNGFFNREGKPLPFIVQKSDGGFSYDSTDLAALKHRVDVEKAERVIILTDAGQSLHFQMLFQAAEKAGYADPKKVRLDHVTFGLVLTSEGKKFKTREGDTEKLIDLLTSAIGHARTLLKERLSEADSEEIDELARTIGIGAVKYADLSCHRQKDYTFSYERMLKFEGNTAVFLLYAYVRILGIKRKVGADLDQLFKNHQIDLKHPSEIALGLHLLRFSEVLHMLTRDLLPNRLTDFLYELAEKFNAFFRDCRVGGSKEEGPRLILCEAVERILACGLQILGLKTVSRM
jgi:arginyl-tRNA synthetase